MQLLITSELMIHEEVILKRSLKKAKKKYLTVQKVLSD